jgi:hypothetical protein
LAFTPGGVEALADLAFAVNWPKDDRSRFIQ